MVCEKGSGAKPSRAFSSGKHSGCSWDCRAVRRCHCYEAGDHGLLDGKLQSSTCRVVALRAASGALLAGGARARRSRATRQVPRPALSSRSPLVDKLSTLDSTLTLSTVPSRALEPSPPSAQQRSTGHRLWRRLFGDLAQNLNPQGAHVLGLLQAQPAQSQREQPQI